MIECNMNESLFTVYEIIFYLGISKDDVCFLLDIFEKGEKKLNLNPSFENSSKSPDPENVQIFKKLQKLTYKGLVEAVDADCMYWAAINSKSCQMTTFAKRICYALGY